MIGEILILAVVLITLVMIVDFFTRKAPAKYAAVEGCGYLMIICIWSVIAICLVSIGFSLIQHGW